MKQSASTGSPFQDGSDIVSDIQTVANVLLTYATSRVDLINARIPSEWRMVVRTPQSVGLIGVGLTSYAVTTRVMEAVGWSPLGGVTMDQSQRGFQRGNEGCGGDPSDPDDPANGNQPAESLAPKATNGKTARTRTRSQNLINRPPLRTQFDVKF